jgi:hypothetical protein
MPQFRKQLLSSPTGPTAGQLMTIRYVITATTTGLNTDGLILKVGEDVGKGGGADMGSPSREGVALRIKALDEHHTTVTDLQWGGGHSGNFTDMFVRGSIRLDQKSRNPDGHGTANVFTLRGDARWMDVRFRRRSRSIRNSI